MAFKIGDPVGWKHPDNGAICISTIKDIQGDRAIVIHQGIVVVIALGDLMTVDDAIAEAMKPRK